LAILFACLWELFENSSFAIERYRIVTAASDYVGDAVINSITDIVACGTGFYLASRLRSSITITFFVFVEISMMFLVRDNLALNVLMLLWPVDAIRHWQIGV